MLKENDYIFSRLSMALDLAVTALAVLIAHALRNYVLAPYVFPEVFRYTSRLSDYWWLLALLPVITVILLRYNGYYQSQRVRNVGSVVAAILAASAGASLIAMVVSFVFTPRGSGSNLLTQAFKGEFVSRGVLLLYPFLSAVLLSIKTIVVRSILLELRNRGYNTRNLLLVGNRDQALDFLEHVHSHPFWGFQVAGLVTDDLLSDVDHKRITVVGGYNDLMPYLESHVVDDVVFVAGRDGLSSLAPMLRGCEEMGIRTRLPLHSFSNRIARPVLDNFDELPVITFNPVKEFGSALFIKYTFDRLAAAALILLLSPVMAVIAVAIKLSSASWSDPVFYGQTRCGLHGRLFTLWKFRSMIVNAESVRRELESMNEMTGPVFKIRNDPRVTAIGRWLRKTSMDELPQLWNVLVGEMSMVGPRPPIPEEVSKYDRWQRRRLSMKPGITCIWQVSGRNKLSFETWMKLDLEYIDNWSLSLDFRILCKTLYVVATGYGAM